MRAQREEGLDRTSVFLSDRIHPTFLIGAIARPALFLVEPDGIISWRRLTDDYRVRMRPEEVLEALNAAN